MNIRICQIYLLIKTNPLIPLSLLYDQYFGRWNTEGLKKRQNAQNEMVVQKRNGSAKNKMVVQKNKMVVQINSNNLNIRNLCTRKGKSIDTPITVL